MKRLLWALFGFLALGAAIVLPYAKAEPPFVPVAVCTEGVCTMSEKDYTALRDFHKQLLGAAKQIQQQNEELEAGVVQLRQEIMKHAFCQGRRT